MSIFSAALLNSDCFSFEKRRTGLSLRTALGAAFSPDIRALPEKVRLLELKTGAGEQVHAAFEEDGVLSASRQVGGLLHGVEDIRLPVVAAKGLMEKLLRER